MKLHVWKNQNGLHLSRPEIPSQLTEVDFDPDQLCRQCGQSVLSISADHSDICPWCESSVNRPKILRYQELDMIRLLQKQSDENRLHKQPKRKLIGNRGTENDLRDYLSSNGFRGGSANFVKLELAAIERPGWVQVFEFHVLVKTDDGKWAEHFGSCRSDERNKSLDVQLFDLKSQQHEAFKNDTSEMITLDRGPRHWTYLPLMLLFGLFFIFAICSAVVSTLDQPSSLRPTQQP